MAYDDELDQAEDTDEAYPEVGELLHIATMADTEELVEVVRDHGNARVLGVSDSRGVERTVVVDCHGIVLELDPPELPARPSFWRRLFAWLNKQS